MPGELLASFRRTLARIAEIERNITAEQVELAALRGEVDELRSLLRLEPTSVEIAIPAGELSFGRKRPIRESSSVGWAKRVLQMAGGPMYVDDIIKNIEHMTGQSVSKATLVSNLSRYVKSSDTFKRTAANTFALIGHVEPEQEIRLVG